MELWLYVFVRSPIKLLATKILQPFISIIINFTFYLCIMSEKYDFLSVNIHFFYEQC